MTKKEVIANLNMIRVAFVEPVTVEQGKLIDDTFDMAIKAIEQESTIKSGQEWTHIITLEHMYSKCKKCGCIVMDTAIDFGELRFCPNCGQYNKGEV